MSETRLLSWYNFHTQKYDCRPAPTTDEEARQYIPQLPAAQGLYKCYRELGKDILEAMLDTLDACVGKPEAQEDKSDGAH